jgi:glycerol-3-phosphate dehydrogenase
MKIVYMDRKFNRLKGNFDILVVGGGIYGAWVAYDASLRGLKVALIDKGDWASGTSSSSTKLIHGGIRYLEMMDFSLVRKALKERSILSFLAPHRVTTVRFHIKCINPWVRLKCAVGVFLYNLMSGIFSLNLLSYEDAQTDDARLVLELVDGALQAGAVCVNYAELGDRFVTDGETGEKIVMSYKYLVDTTGRWCKKSKRLQKGVHLVMPKISNDASLFIKRDGRVVFAVPWYERTLLGTTDTTYSGDLDDIQVTQEEIDYLLEDTNWEEGDIISSFAGVRVLRDEENNTRDWELIQENNVFYSIGGKMTSARLDASEILDRITNIECKTFKEFPWNRTYHSTKIIEELEFKYNIDKLCGKYLIRRYGSKLSKILTIIKELPHTSDRIYQDLPFIHAELIYCEENEMVVKEEDLLRRRIPINILMKKEDR